MGNTCRRKKKHIFFLFHYENVCRISVGRRFGCAIYRQIVGSFISIYNYMLALHLPGFCVFDLQILYIFINNIAGA